MKFEIVKIRTSEQVRVGLGLEFPGIGGFWSTAEMLSNARKGIPNVPCAEWDKQRGQYKYYVITRPV